ncbi:MAG: GtrA family protein [Methylococcales bacterium]|nr:GtrA family protein [Methylococcales bacterium]
MPSTNFINTFSRYLFSGGTAVSVQFSTLILLVEYAPQINTTISAVIAFSIGCIVNYNIQYHWTFKVTGSHKRFFTRYLSVTFVTLGLNTSIFWYFHEYVHLSYLFSQFFASGIVFMFNFLINNFFTFKMPTTESRIKTEIETKSFLL